MPLWLYNSLDVLALHQVLLGHGRDNKVQPSLLGVRNGDDLSSYMTHLLYTPNLLACYFQYSVDSREGASQSTGLWALVTNHEEVRLRAFLDPSADREGAEHATTSSVLSPVPCKKGVHQSLVRQLHTAQSSLKPTVAKEDLEVLVFLPPPPQCWDYCCVPPGLGHFSSVF